MRKPVGEKPNLVNGKAGQLGSGSVEHKISTCSTLLRAEESGYLAYLLFCGFAAELNFAVKVMEGAEFC